MLYYDFLHKTDFTRMIMRANHWSDQKISAWIFAPGMTFQSMNKWWGDSGRRNTPHEGLDLCLYKDSGGTHSLDPRTLIPAMFDGRVVKIMNDFLGTTIVMEHGQMDRASSKFLTIYGHANPIKNLHVDIPVKKGDVICSISGPEKAKNHGLLPHLHITVGALFSEISYDHLDWNSIPASRSLTLLDPMPGLDWPFEIRETAHEFIVGSEALKT